MKVALILCLILAVAQADQLQANATNIKDFVLGLLIGVGAAERVPSGFDCQAKIFDVSTQWRNITSNCTKINADTLAVFFSYLSVTVKPVSDACKNTSLEGGKFFTEILHSFTNATLRDQGIKNMVSNMGTVLGDL
jgi:hypothetical protein